TAANSPAATGSYDYGAHDYADAGSASPCDAFDEHVVAGSHRSWTLAANRNRPGRREPRQQTYRRQEFGCIAQPLAIDADGQFGKDEYSVGGRKHPPRRAFTAARDPGLHSSASARFYPCPIKSFATGFAPPAAAVVVPGGFT